MHLHMSAVPASLRVRFGWQPALQQSYPIVCREYSSDVVCPTEVPPALLLGGHFAQYASDDDAESAASTEGADASDVETVHEEPVDHMPSPAPCSDNESDDGGADSIPADYIDFDEADELSYVVHQEAHMRACSSPSTLFATSCRSELEVMGRPSLSRFGSDPTSLA